VAGAGPPYGLLPVDACLTIGCLQAGSNQINGLYTSMTFREYGGARVIGESFEIMEVTLEPLLIPGAPVPPPPPVLAPSAPTSAPGPPTPVLPPTPAPPIPAAAISVEAAAAGFIAAGWTAIGVRHPPQATKQASMTGPLSKKRKPPRGSGKLPLFRWE